MNYIIEDNIDFYKELEKSPITDISKCLISHTILDNNHITLPCNHTFNYKPLFYEVSNQKKYNHLEIIHLKENQIKCPYCRSVSEKLLPYYQCYNIPLIRGVNYPYKFAMITHKCQYIYKSGKKSGHLCNDSACNTNHGILCNKHYKFKNKSKQNSTENSTINNSQNSIQNTINPNKLKLFNDQLNNYQIFTISELKIILRVNNCKLAGNKQCLIDRIIIKKNELGNSWKNM